MCPGFPLVLVAPVLGPLFLCFADLPLELQRTAIFLYQALTPQSLQ